VPSSATSSFGERVEPRVGPALTEHHLGTGAAYYHATAFDAEALRRFYAGLIASLRLRRALGAELPPGVSVQRRTDAQREFLFVQNFSDTAQSILLPRPCMDLLTGERLAALLELPAWGSTVLRSG
jgi:beta-galactosidase